MDTEKLRAEDVREEEKKDEEKEAKAECSEEEKDAKAKAEDEKDSDLDLMEALVQRLEGIESRLAALEGGGEDEKKEDDKKDDASARRKALVQKLNAVCAPMPSVAVKPVAVAETPEEENKRFKATYKNFDALMADFIKRK